MSHSFSADELESMLSLLPTLSPLSTMLLALSLAYLRLEPFQYWKQIQRHAAKALEKLPIAAQAHDNTAYFRQIASFAGKIQDREAQRIPGVRGWISWALFNTGADRIVSTGMTILSLALVILSSAHATSESQWLAGWFAKGQILWTLWILSALISFSVFLVFLGAWYVSRACQRIDDSVAELNKHVSASVATAKLQNSRAVN